VFGIGYVWIVFHLFFRCHHAAVFMSLSSATTLRP
jgi:hypothetical protein